MIISQVMRKRVLAPAKVNLHLSVGEKRNDGFHVIESVFARTSLCDEMDIAISQSDKPLFFIKGLEGVCDPGKDTMSKAFFLWSEVSQISLALKVRIAKHIPSQAGLGGGSSDAASLLLALESHFPLGRKTLWEIGARVGSDVPFFLSRERLGWVTGRGEHVEPIDGIGPLWGALVMPKEVGCSTREAYVALDAIPRPLPPPKERVLGVLRQGTAAYQSVLYNDFFRLMEQRQSYKNLEDASVGVGGYGALSGSGSCWFFVSEEEEGVERFLGRLEQLYQGQYTSWRIQI